MSCLDIDDMSLIQTFEFNTFSHPWHIDASLSENKVFVALAGDVQEDSGVSCLEFGQENGSFFLNELWRNTNSSYGTLHGITISNDGQYVYASGRTDGKIYKFDSLTGIELESFQIVDIGGTRMGGIAISQQASCGSGSCCD